jgi:hypothetical protein
MNDIEDAPPEFDSRRNNACAPLSPDEFARVLAAAEMYLSSRSVLTTLISILGDLVEKGLNMIPANVREDIIANIHGALVLAQNASTTQMLDEPGRNAKPWSYLAAVIGTGAVGGSAGWTALLAELPVTTGLMLRSIADVGRAYGERLDDPLFRQTCIEVFAYGSPIEDDEEELAFIMAWLGAADMVARVAVRYAAALGPKIAAISPPIAGAVAGATMNAMYMSFYQSMARVLFTLLPLERRYDPAMVRSCFAAVVREMRDRQSARARRK